MSKFAVLFDLDGTLVHSLPDIAGAMNVVREQEGLLPISEEATRRFIGKGADHLIRGCIPERPESDNERLTNAYRDYYFEHPHRFGHLYPGVEATLERLSRQKSVVLGVVTNKPSKVADKTLDYYLPQITFAAVMGPERVSQRKPEPQHLLETLGLLSIAPDRACFVGDDPVDMACADSANVRFFGAGYGFGGVTAQGRQLANFSELLGHLEKLIGEKFVL